MNWKLMLQLSVFGLAMGIATVFLIPSNIEPFFWLVIFLISAYLIATRAPGRYFLHGLMVSLLNSVWITAAHIALFESYIANHQKELEMMSSIGLSDSPRLMMALTGPLIGFVSGVVLGVFSVVASKLVPAARRRTG